MKNLLVVIANFKPMSEEAESYSTSIPERLEGMIREKRDSGVPLEYPKRYKQVIAEYGEEGKRKKAKEIGLQKGAHLVLWGSVGSTKTKDGKKEFYLEPRITVVNQLGPTKLEERQPGKLDVFLSEPKVVELRRSKIEETVDIVSLIHGLAIHKQQDYHGAIKIFKGIKNPDAEVSFYHGTALMLLKRFEEALEQFDKATMINPQDANAWGNKGATLGELGKHEEAITCYDKAIQIDPRYADAFNNRGTAYANKGEYNRAILNYNKALEINPRDAKAYYNRGTAYADKGEYDRAIRDFNEALEINPMDAEAYYNRGNTYEKKGEYDRAIRDFNEAKEIDPDKYGEKSPPPSPKEPLPDEPPPPRQTPPSARVHRDSWTTDDELNYGPCADAIFEFIKHKDTKPPFVIGIQAPWGQGKTSLMSMIQERLDPHHPHLVEYGNTSSNSKQTGMTLKQLMNCLDRDEVPFETTEPEETEQEEAGRERLTVWFNPWKYQSSEEIWAGLAHTILSQLTEKLSPLEREKFWLRLQLKRIDSNAIRSDIHRAIFASFLPKVISSFMIVVGTIFFVGIMLIAARVFGRWSGLGGSVLLCGSIIGGLWKSYNAWTKARTEALNRKLDGAYTRYVQQPDYVGRMGFLHLVEEDMKRVFDLLVDKEHPAVIFIDDLDRCSPTKVGQVIEAINMFLSGNYPSVFVLGIDAQVVAASMEVIHEKIIGKLEDRGGELGWRFMDKFVQLPFVIPRLSPKQQEAYLKHLLGPQRVSKSPPAEAIKRAEEISRGVQSGELEPVEAVRQVAEITPDLAEADPEADSKLKKEVLSVGAEKFTDEDPKMHRELEKWRSFFLDNPRTIKRVVNLYRFHRFVSYARQMEGLEYATTEEIACWVVVIVRWPHFVRWLQAHAQTESSKEKGQKLIALAIKQTKSDGSVNDWTEYLEKMSIVHTGWGSDRDLWRFLHEKDISDETLLRASECGLW